MLFSGDGDWCNIFRCNAIAVLPGVGKSCQRSPVPFSHFHKNTLVSKSNFLSRTKPASLGFGASAVVGGRLVEGAAACPTDAAPGLEQAGVPLSLTHFWGKGRKLRVKGSSFGSSIPPAQLFAPKAGSHASQSWRSPSEPGRERRGSLHGHSIPFAPTWCRGAGVLNQFHPQNRSNSRTTPGSITERNPSAVLQEGGGDRGHGAGRKQRGFRTTFVFIVKKKKGEGEGERKEKRTEK